MDASPPGRPEPEGAPAPKRQETVEETLSKLKLAPEHLAVIERLLAREREDAAAREREQAAAAPPQAAATVIARVLDAVPSWPSCADVLANLKDLPGSAWRRTTPVKADLTTGRPSIVLDALDLRLNDFGPSLTQLDMGVPYGRVMLGPSGSGKTRKIVQYLARDKAALGFFIPFKMAQGDRDKFGSSALYTVLTSVDLVETRDEAALMARRERLEFAASCVVVAYDAVLRAWKRKRMGSNERESAAWALAQMYPDQIFDRDVFEKLTLALFESCDAVALRQSTVDPRACFIDEAQGITELGLSVLRPTWLRSALGAVITGIRNVLGVNPILAGTGFSLSLEYKSLTSRMGVADNPSWAFTDFPPLNAATVVEMLKKRLHFHNDEAAAHAAKWLQGRPRWTAVFIEKMLYAGHANVTAALVDDYVAHLCKPPERRFRWEEKPTTPAEAFVKLRAAPPDLPVPVIDRAHAQEPLPADRTASRSYFDGLHHAFLLTQGLPPQVRENTLLSEVDIAYITNVLSATSVEVKVEMEPIVLRSALEHIHKYEPGFTLKLVTDKEGDPGAMGKAFEYFVVDQLLPLPLTAWLPSTPEWKRFVGGGGPLSADEAKALQAAIGRFSAGEWTSSHAEYGRVAAKGNTVADTEEWLRRRVFPSRLNQPTRRIWDVWPACFYPDNDAGPAVMQVRWRSDDPAANPMLVLVQVKLIKGSLVDGGLGTPQVRDALLTVDPAKLYAVNRGKADERVEGLSMSQTTLFKRIKDVPVVRMLVSGAATVDEERTATGFVRSGRPGLGFDLQVVVDRAKLEALLRREPLDALARLRGLDETKG